MLPEMLEVIVQKDVQKVTLMRGGQSIRFRLRGDRITIYTRDISLAGAMFADGFQLE